jgi:hypothetical protein
MKKFPEKLCDGKTMFLIGGGPSLKGVDLSALETRQDQVIVANNAYKLFPKALVAHHADYVWWEWNKELFAATFTGEFKSTTGIGGAKSCYDLETWCWLRRGVDHSLSLDRTEVNGMHAGHQILNIAFFLGAKRIVLLGYDFCFGKAGETQWHSDHQRETNTEMWAKRMLPNFKTTLPFLEAAEVHVVNANPDSMLKDFEFIDDYRKFL